MPRALLLVLFGLVFLPACDKGSSRTPPPVGPAEPAKEKTPSVKTPLGVPKELGERVRREWPGIEEQGELFLAKFEEALSAHRAGDRETLDVAIEEANVHFDKALTGWNEIYYSVDDLPESRAEKCRRYLRKWNQQVDEWTKKNKALKEFSRAK